jgi:hypothetical protein
VIEAQPRIGHVFLGEIDQARVDTKALQRRLQIARELAQVEEQHALTTLQQPVELGEERRFVASSERVRQRRYRGTELVAQSCGGVRHGLCSRQPPRGSCRSFP